MATANPFDILGDDDNDDPSQLIAKQEKKIQSKKAASPAPAPTPAASATSKFPTKPSPPTQAVRETRTNYSGSGGFARGGSGRGGGRGGAGRPREFRSDDNGFNDRAPTGAREGGRDANISSDLSRQPYRGPRRGGYQEGDFGRPRRMYERHSGTGRGNEMQRQGSGRGNWGSFTDEPVPQEHEELMKDQQKVTLTEKPTEEALDAESKDNKNEFANEAGEKEAEEDKEMTLEEYEKIKEENKKALLSLKTEERKVEIDKDLQSMQLLSTKKGTDEVFIKLGSGKDAQKKKDAERDERAKKSVSITEFLKPAEGERYHVGGRGRGNRGRGQYRGGYSGGGSRGQAAPAIEDQLQFPTLGGK